ncbi:MAG: 3'(2'),5'-bisphosphate nucleotidase CysQ [Terriglobales bacterium]
MKANSNAETLQRIEAAIEAASVIFDRFTPGAIAAEYKAGHDPVTEADRAVDAALRKELLRDGEGWLSEETVDDLSRLNKTRVWIVDPLDGTREFVTGIPEFCVSIAMVEDGMPVAGGICNPATKETFIGALGTGVQYNGEKVFTSQRAKLEDALVLASRSEVKRGEWETFKSAPFQIKPVGSVAYKLALVSAGLADATFTLTPKSEWDVAAGAALVLSAGGSVQTLENVPLRCNKRNPLLSGLIASGLNLQKPLNSLLKDYLHPSVQVQA